MSMSGGKSFSWNDPKIRAIFWQVGLLVLVVGVLWFFAATARANLERQNIATGFSFLSNTAGFGIIQSLIPYTEESSYGRAFLVGLLNTLLVAVIGTVIAVTLGFIIGVARLSSNWLVAKLAAAYVEIFRNTPLLLQLFFWYFAILSPLPGPREALVVAPGVYLSNRGLVTPSPHLTDSSPFFFLALLIAIIGVVFLTRWARKRRIETGQTFPLKETALALLVGLPALAWLLTGQPLRFEGATLGAFNHEGGLRMLPEFVALLFGLSIYTAAFIAEIVRAGIRSVSRGQNEAAAALGLKPGTAMRLVIIPQALRVIIPPLTSQVLNLTKNSSLAVAIAYPELVSVFAGTVLNQTGQAIEVIAITMAVYLFISLAASFGMNLYNARVALKER